MLFRSLKQFLDSENVKYVCISHSPAYTMSEIAHAAHIPGKTVAKTVMVKIGETMAMVVVPSSMHVDLEMLREATGAGSAELANEKDFQDLFPGCEPGSMPPFGNLYGLDVFVSPALAGCEHIAFNAGTHTELIQLAYKDFERLAAPKVVDVALTN